MAKLSDETLTTDNGQANLEAANASIQEIKRGWNLS
jgi:hypothetical protein